MASIMDFADSVNKLMDVPKEEYFSEFDDMLQYEENYVTDCFNSLNNIMFEIKDGIGESNLLLSNIASASKFIVDDVDEDDYGEDKSVKSLQSIDNNIKSMAGDIKDLGDEEPSFDPFAGKDPKESKKSSDLLKGLGKGISGLGLGALSMVSAPFKVLGNLSKSLFKSAWIIAAGIAALQAFKGWKDAAKIAEKSEEDLTLLDRSIAAVSNVISFFSFGLLDVNTVFKKIDGFIDYLFGKKGLLVSTVDKLTPIIMKAKDVALEVFRNLPTLFENIIGVLKFIADSPVGDVIAKFRDISLTVFDGLLETISWLFGDEGLFIQPKKAVENAMNLFGDIGSWILDGLKSTIVGIYDFFFGEKGIFTLSNIKNALIATINDMGALGKMAGSLFGGLFGGDDEEEKSEVSSSSPSESSFRFSDTQPVEGKPTYDSVMSPKVLDIQSSGVERQSSMPLMMQPVQSKSTENFQLTKERMVERETVREPAPQQPVIMRPEMGSSQQSGGGRVVLSIDDMGLSMINSSVME